MASVDDVVPLFYGERTGRGKYFIFRRYYSMLKTLCYLAMNVHCPGQPGHGSLLLDNTAGEKASKMLDKFYEFRDHEKKKLEDPSLTSGDVTAVNLTIMEVLIDLDPESI